MRAQCRCDVIMISSFVMLIASRSLSFEKRKTGERASVTCGSRFCLSRSRSLNYVAICVSSHGNSRERQTAGRPTSSQISYRLNILSLVLLISEGKWILFPYFFWSGLNFLGQNLTGRSLVLTGTVGHSLGSFFEFSQT